MLGWSAHSTCEERKIKSSKSTSVPVGWNPRKTFFVLCPEKWDDDYHAMEKLMDSFQSLWDESWGEQKFREGVAFSTTYTLKTTPPMKPIQKLGQEVGRKMIDFMMACLVFDMSATDLCKRDYVPGVAEQEDVSLVREFCKRYYVPGASWLDDNIVRDLGREGVLARKERDAQGSGYWLKELVKLQLDERERGRKSHFCRRGEKDGEDGVSVCSREAKDGSLTGRGHC